MNIVKMKMVEIPAFLTVFTSLTNLDVGLHDKENLSVVLIFLDCTNIFLMIPQRCAYYKYVIGDIFSPMNDDRNMELIRTSKSGMDACK